VVCDGRCRAGLPGRAHQTTLLHPNLRVDSPARAQSARLTPQLSAADLP
jgi:hypothetical protein